MHIDSFLLLLALLIYEGYVLTVDVLLFDVVIMSLSQVLVLLVFYILSTIALGPEPGKT
jgi:hypothetical protein